MLLFVVVFCFVLSNAALNRAMYLYLLGLGTGTDNRTAIFTGISPQN